MAIQENRAFLEMRNAAESRLAGRSPEEIGERAGVPFDGSAQAFSLASLGQALTVRYPSYEIVPPVGEWHCLVLLHYLEMADGTPLSGRLVPFGELKDGLVRGGGFDRTCEQTMAGYFAKKPLENLRAVCEALGAEILPSNADLCAVFPFLPRYPVTMKLWLAEEEDEIDGSGRLFVDSSADHYLSIEDAVTVGSLLLHRLRERYEERYPG